jgi:hypothetical protein
MPWIKDKTPDIKKKLWYQTLPFIVRDIIIKMIAAVDKPIE